MEYITNSKINVLTSEELVSVLCNCENDIMFNRLGISVQHYNDRDTSSAKEFYKIGVRKIHPDVCKIPGCERAFVRLRELYQGMTSCHEELMNNLKGKTKPEVIDSLISIVQNRDGLTEYVNNNKVTVKALKYVAIKLNINFKMNYNKNKMLEILS